MFDSERLVVMIGRNRGPTLDFDKASAYDLDRSAYDRGAPGGIAIRPLSRSSTLPRVSSRRSRAPLP